MTAPQSCSCSLEAISSIFPLLSGWPWTDSSWNSLLQDSAEPPPLLLIQVFFMGKKDGGLHPCIHCRDLNMFTVQSVTPYLARPLYSSCFKQPWSSYNLTKNLLCERSPTNWPSDILVHTVLQGKLSPTMYLPRSLRIHWTSMCPCCVSFCSYS